MHPAVVSPFRHGASEGASSARLLVPRSSLRTKFASAMFRQQLEQTTAKADQAYDAETEQMLNPLVEMEMKYFMEGCQRAAENRERGYSRNVNVDAIFCRNGGEELVVRKFKECMSELGFPDGVSEVGQAIFGGRWCSCLTLSADWEADQVSCRVEETIAEGTCIACPVCLEHRPAVALVPCGHVICRDCQRCQQVQQCPMCRQPITSATRGLFMD